MTKTLTIPDDYRPRFPNIPAKLFAYLNRLLKTPCQNSQFHLAMENHPEHTFTVLDQRFSECSKIVSLSPDDLLMKLDFQLKDLSPERIESLLGELRTIHFLANNAFTNITPIRSGFSKNEDRYLIEVATSIYSAPRTLHHSLVKWANSRLQNDGKLAQMSERSNAYRSLFVCILNSSGALALNKRSDYQKIIKEIWEEVGSIQNLHIAIVTGLVTEEGQDDCVYPEFENV
jgi:hypothetical protein